MDFKPMPTSLLASMAELAARRLESGDVPGTDQAMRDLFDPHMHSHLGCGGRVRSQTLRYSRVDIPTRPQLPRAQPFHASTKKMPNGTGSGSGMVL
jgi:hypothetical protein